MSFEDNSRPTSEAELLHRPRRFKLLLLNCPDSITTDDVLTHYQERLGRHAVECCKWFYNGCGKFIGSGILVFDTEESADEAALLPGPTVMGRQVEVESPKGVSTLDKDSELYVWGLPPSAVAEDLHIYYANVGLQRLKFRMRPDYSTTVGVAFVNFESPEAAMKALAMGPPEIRGVKCCVKPSGYQGEKEVCIRGSDKLTDAVLRKQYEAFGADGILSIQWQRGGHDPSSSCRAFVCFKTAEMALQALAQGDFMFGDEVMEVFKTGKKFKLLKKEDASEAGEEALHAAATPPLSVDTPRKPSSSTAPAPRPLSPGSPTATWVPTSAPPMPSTGCAPRPLSPGTPTATWVPTSAPPMPSTGCAPGPLSPHCPTGPWVPTSVPCTSPPSANQQGTHSESPGFPVRRAPPAALSLLLPLETNPTYSARAAQRASIDANTLLARRDSQSLSAASPTPPSLPTTPPSDSHTHDGWRMVRPQPRTVSPADSLPTHPGAQTSPPASSAFSWPTSPSVLESHTNDWWRNSPQGAVRGPGDTPDLRQVERQLVIEAGRRLLAERLVQRVRSQPPRSETPRSPTPRSQTPSTPSASGSDQE